MSIKIVKAVTPIPRGSSGSQIMATILESISQAQRRVRQEGGVILPACNVSVVIEQEYDDGE